MDYYLILGIIITFLVIVIASVLTIYFLKKKKNTKEVEYPELLEAFGGKDNIIDFSSKGSRVSVVVENKKIVDKEKLKEQGIETIVVSNKKFTILVGNKKSILVYNYLKKEINS